LYQEANGWLPEYGRFSECLRNEVSFQLEILLQWDYLELDDRSCLVPVGEMEQDG
jgi:hypothetical protein